jgi:hypothetical protein
MVSNNTGLYEREDSRVIRIDERAIGVSFGDFVSECPLMNYIESLKRHQIS